MIGVAGRYLSWIVSFLDGRTQLLNFGGASSRTISVPSGAPQGLHLGPVLFALFVNDRMSCFV